jgi:hypothetical protein
MQAKGYVMVDTCSKQWQYTYTSFATVCCITKASQFVSCREIIAVYWTNHLKHINILCEQNVEFVYCWSVCSKFELPVQIRALSLCMSLSAAIDCLLLLTLLLFIYFHFFNALNSSFGELLYEYLSLVFVISVIIQARSGTEPLNGPRPLRSPCFPLYYLLTNIWSRKRPSHSYWYLFLVSNKNEDFANCSPLHYIVEFLFVCLSDLLSSHHIQWLLLCFLARLK